MRTVDDIAQSLAEDLAEHYDDNGGNLQKVLPLIQTAFNEVQAQAYAWDIKPITLDNLPRFSYTHEGGTAIATGEPPTPGTNFQHMNTVYHVVVR